MRLSSLCGQLQTIATGERIYFTIVRGHPEHDPEDGSIIDLIYFTLLFFRCGNIAAILELDENLQRNFPIFEAAPQEQRGLPSKKPQPDYFL